MFSTLSKGGRQPAASIRIVNMQINGEEESGFTTKSPTLVFSAQFADIT